MKNTRISGPSLPDETAAVEADYPAWHVWVSSGGQINATHARTRAEMRAVAARHGTCAGSGITLNAPTPALIRHEIAVWQRNAEVAA